jgi:hypothetical protein
MAEETKIKDSAVRLANHQIELLLFDQLRAAFNETLEGFSFFSRALCRYV